MLDLKKMMTSELRNIKNIKRYSSTQVNHVENVAEHSFWVAYYALLIGKDLFFIKK